MDDIDDLVEDLIDDLKQRRDKLRVQMHLASMEAQEEWKDLEEKMEHFKAQARLGKSSDEVGDALGKLGHELELGYDRMIEAIKDS